MNYDNEEIASSGTNIGEVKRKNAESGMSYNEVLEILAQTGGHGTAAYSNTDTEKAKKDIHSREN